IWVTAARQGLSVTVVSAPQSHPFAPFLEGKRFGGNFGWNLTLMDVYPEHRNDDGLYGADDLAPRPAAGWPTLRSNDGELREVEMPLRGRAFPGLLYDDPEDPTRGFDTLALAATKQSTKRTVLKARPALGPDASAFAPFVAPLPEGNVTVQLRL